jgi:hypothetical protein
VVPRNDYVKSSPEDGGIRYLETFTIEANLKMGGEQVPPKHWYISTSLDEVTYHMTVIFTGYAVFFTTCLHV